MQRSFCRILMHVPTVEFSSDMIQANFRIQLHSDRSIQSKLTHFVLRCEHSLNEVYLYRLNTTESGVLFEEYPLFTCTFDISPKGNFLLLHSLHGQSCRLYNKSGDHIICTGMEELCDRNSLY